MSLLPVLGQVVLGYSPLIDREHSPVAVRLTVFPEPRTAAPDALGLLQALATVWPVPSEALPAAPAAPGPAAPVLLNITSEPWLRALLACRPPPHVMLEVPAFMAANPAYAADLHALRAAGSVLMVKGRPVDDLPPEMVSCFRYALVDRDDDPAPRPVQAGSAVHRIGAIHVGVSTLADLDAAVARGAVGVMGWPIQGEFASAGAGNVGADVAVVTELIQRVDREEPVERLEAVVRNDPQLAFRLIRHLNSAAYGLAIEVSTFRHALMMMGYRKLKRWLALMLVSAGRAPALKPAMFAAVRRGLLLEELVRATADDEMRGEMFICGVFSLLDRMLGQSFAQLFQSLPVSARVQQALVSGDGPYHPYLALVQALEQGVRGDILAAADQSFLELEEVNAALLRALAAARSLE
jgi:EAL and modified HD-GYP domain-containing signal transduction protein